MHEFDAKHYQLVRVDPARISERVGGSCRPRLDFLGRLTDEVPATPPLPDEPKIYRRLQEIQSDPTIINMLRVISKWIRRNRPSS